ncbi:MAG: hypothetical protein HC859_17395 [Bacteroidia bacterium]|nr:hypothetical protein [Bacteroidia bacterium]
MKVCGFVLIFLPILAAAQQEAFSGSERNIEATKGYLREFMATDEMVDETAVARVEELIASLSAKRNKLRRDEDFVQLVFARTHTKVLKRYEPYTSFGNMMTTGGYDCLTATALYAVLLNHFGYECQVIETNYHIFLTTTLNGKLVMLESTDPINGFVTNHQEIEERIKTARQPVYSASLAAKNTYEFNVDIFNAVRAEQLPGLLYYNKAVNAYNRRDLEAAVNALGQAVVRYASPRIQEFSSLIRMSLENSDLSESARADLFRKLALIQRHATQVVAVN